jgi:transposase
VRSGGSTCRVKKASRPPSGSKPTGKTSAGGRGGSAVAGVKAEMMWLPAYSPDFSPIEECWSKVKTLVRGRALRTPKELNAALSDTLEAVTPDDIDGWFRHCGY